jgi:hypothetical protein
MPDALQQHLQATSEINWSHPPVQLSTRLANLQPASDIPDTHSQYIDKVDKARSDERAANMHQALVQVRRDARDKQELSFSLLQYWQQFVLQSDQILFRKYPAYAKNGLEIYDIDVTTEQCFVDKLGNDGQDTAHPICKAVRTYLDICFFHPFNDGNARSARLAYDFYTFSIGYSFKDLRPLFSLPRAAGRKDEYLNFLELAIFLCEKSKINHFPFDE